MTARRLKRSFYRRDPVTLARALLGQVLVRRLAGGEVLRGRIVEVEAYLGAPDRAAHSFGGRHTTRNASMWLDGGHAYVYFTYGMHFCVNVVAEREGVPTACLLRALEPLEGIEAMRRQRGAKRSPERLRDTDLCSGPAKLTEAFAIDRTLDGVDLVASELLFLERGKKVGPIARGPRIGVGYAAEWAEEPLRFYVRGSPHVSGRDGTKKLRAPSPPKKRRPLSRGEK